MLTRGVKRCCGRVLLFLAFLIATPKTPHAQIYDCGSYGQRPCQECYYIEGDAVCGSKYCDGGFSIDSNRCEIDRSSWLRTGLDTSRHETHVGLSSILTCGGTGQLNCWQYDDQVRDNLNMDANALTFVETATPGGAFPASGRFIFVYRTSDNKLLMRRYDRAHTDDPGLHACLGYANYRYQPNYRGDLYDHVRHSQLNGGWSDVWCAGELTIRDGKLWRLNNASGHYKPAAVCLSYVEVTFRAFGYAFDSDFQKGALNLVSTAETSCPPNPSPTPGPDDHDEL